MIFELQVRQSCQSATNFEKLRSALARGFGTFYMSVVGKKFLELLQDLTFHYYRRDGLGYLYPSWMGLGFHLV